MKEMRAVLLLLLQRVGYLSAFLKCLERLKLVSAYIYLYIYLFFDKCFMRACQSGFIRFNSIWGVFWGVGWGVCALCLVWPRFNSAHHAPLSPQFIFQPLFISYTDVSAFLISQTNSHVSIAACQF